MSCNGKCKCKERELELKKVKAELKAGKDRKYINVVFDIAVGILTAVVLISIFGEFL